MNKRPMGSDDKYWTGTKNFNETQYESDVSEYICGLEEEVEKWLKICNDRNGQIIDLKISNDSKDETIQDLKTEKQELLFEKDKYRKALEIALDDLAEYDRFGKKGADYLDWYLKEAETKIMEA